MDNRITPEMLATLEAASERELDFWKRHGIEHEGEKSGHASSAHRAWVACVTHEYKKMGTDVRVQLDAPLARKAFILGFNCGQKL